MKESKHVNNNVNLSRNTEEKTYHHQMTIFAFINHRILASAEVHTTLLSCLDLKLDAVRRSDVNTLFPHEDCRLEKR